MKQCVKTSILATVLLAGLAQAATRPGAILLLDRCPGDTLVQDEAISNEALLEALLTPLLIGIVDSGLKTTGEKLKAAAQEAQVDVLHVGSHFYQWRESSAANKAGYWDVASRCVVVASRQTKSTKTKLDDLVEGYEAFAITVTGDGDRSLAAAANGERALRVALVNAGFEDGAVPGLMAVLDVELSAQKSEFRLVPRFVVMDHSIREKKVDRYPRDVTLEFFLAAARGKSAFARGLLKMEGLSIGAAHSQVPGGARLASHWMALPALNDVEKTRMDAARTLETRQALHEQAARFAAAAAIALDANEWVDPNGKRWEPVEPDLECPAIGTSEPDWYRAYGLLQAEIARSKKDPAAINRWTNVVTYFDSCNQSQKAKESLTGSALTVGALARSFDLTLAIREFRERPVAMFFGEILADDATREDLTSAIVGSIDPATRAAAAEVDAKARLALLEAYEEAVHQARKSMIAYDAAKEADRATRLLKMHYDQRAANRAAQALGLALPYPEAGTWIGP